MFASQNNPAIVLTSFPEYVNVAHLFFWVTCIFFNKTSKTQRNMFLKTGRGGGETDHNSAEKYKQHASKTETKYRELKKLQ
jgi:hypothetical protein